MTKNYTPLDIRRLYLKRLVIMGVGLFIVGFVSVYLFVRGKTTSSSVRSSVRAQIYDTPASDTIEFVRTSTTRQKPSQDYSAIVGKVMKYTSAQLGVEFMYLTDEHEVGNTGAPTAISVSRNFNTICLSASTASTANNDCKGDAMEVYVKSPDQSFEQAIRGYMLLQQAADCDIQITKQENREIAQITARTPRCPIKYTAAAGTRYFQLDTRYPGRVIFFSLGSYTILADADYIPWQQTVRILSP